MRNPGRRDSGDSRQDRSDEPAPQAAEGVDAPGDGDVAAASTPDGPHRTPIDDQVTDDTTVDDALVDDAPADDTAPEAGPDDAAAPAEPRLTDGDPPDPDPTDGVVAVGPADRVDLHLDDLPDDLCGDLPDDLSDDDLLFDPLLCDEPVDLAAVRADDALIDALAGGDPAAARGLVDVDDPLIAMLAAWAASVRPAAPVPAADRPTLTIVGAHPDDSTAATTATASTVDGDADEADDTGFDPAGDADPADVQIPERAGHTTTVVPLLRPVGGDEPPTVRLVAPVRDATGVPAAVEPPTVPALAPVRSASAATGAPATVHDDGAHGDRAHEGRAHDETGRRLLRPPLRGIGPVRIPRRLPAPGARPTRPTHPVRRAAVAVAIALLGVSAAAAAGGTARPGDVGFPMTRVFFAERAKSLEAAQVVADGLVKARVYLEHRRPDLAAQELAAVDTALPDVRDEEGHPGLVDQQQRLETAVALAPPFTPDPTAAGKDAHRPRQDSDPTVLADPAPADGADGADADGREPAQRTPDGAASDGTGSGGTGSGGTGSGGTGSGGTGSGGTGSGGTKPDGTDVLAAPGHRTGEPGAARSAAKGDLPLAAASTVGGVTDEGRASVDPATTSGTTTAPTSPATSTRPSAPSSRTSAADEPTDSRRPSRSGTANSTSPTSTTRDTPDPGDGAGSGDGGSAPADNGSGSVAAVPAGGGTAFVVRPAIHHDAAQEPVEPVVARHDDADDAEGAEAHGSVVAGSDDPPAVLPQNDPPGSTGVVVTTVPAPVHVDPVPPVHVAPAHVVPARHEVAGSHTSGVGETGQRRAAARAR